MMFYLSREGGRAGFIAESGTRKWIVQPCPFFQKQPCLQKEWQCHRGRSPQVRPIVAQLDKSISFWGSSLETQLVCRLKPHCPILHLSVTKVIFCSYKILFYIYCKIRQNLNIILMYHQSPYIEF